MVMRPVRMVSLTASMRVSPIRLPLSSGVHTTTTWAVAESLARTKRTGWPSTALQASSACDTYPANDAR